LRKNKKIKRKVGVWGSILFCHWNTSKGSGKGPRGKRKERGKDEMGVVEKVNELYKRHRVDKANGVGTIKKKIIGGGKKNGQKKD